MGRRRTTVSDRNTFVDLKLAGRTLEEIADGTGWSFECVRHWWRALRAYRDDDRKALDPPDRRTQRGGPMSTFPSVVRFAFLRIKKEHPGWGAEVARPRVAERLGLPEEALPSVSTIERYWAQFKGRLYKRHRKQRPQAQESDTSEAPEEPHERWQADFKVKIDVDGVGQVDVFDIRDDVSPVKVGSYVYHSNEWDVRDIQSALRDAFTPWGLCDRLQTDKEKRLVSTGEHPFPTDFTLWLAGLGIEHEFAGSAQENGCAERFHRTWHQRVVEGQRFEDLNDLQSCSDQELLWMNQRLPSHGRDGNGSPPVEAYPSAQTPRRAYTSDRELDIFSLDRVYRYLAEQHWWRWVSQVGQISLGNHQYTVGAEFARQDVKVTFDATTTEFVVHDAQENEIKRLTPRGLTVQEITGLDPSVSN